MLETKNNPFYYIIIIIICFFSFFINNNVVPADYMESRNLATAQEMVQYGNYLMPTMNGELRLEKPPLPTWIAAAVEHISPDNLVAQRCMSGLSATLMVLFLFLLASRLTKNYGIGFIAALVLASTYNAIMMGRTVTWDIYCHSFMLGAIYFLVLALEKDGKQWAFFILSGLFMGLSFLSKGPVSFYALLLPFLICYIFVFRPRLRGKLAPLLTMILICILLSVWWYAFIWFFHHEELLSVVNKESSAWVDHNVKPFYYYWKFPAEAGIWASFWVTAIIFFFVSRKNRDNRNVFAFSIVWTILALVLLSVIPEKKTRYLLPLLIPGAVNIAFYIYYSFRYDMTKAAKGVFRTNAVIIALIVAALPVVMYFFFVREDSISIPVYIILSVLLLSLAIGMFTALWNKKRGISVMRVFGCIILAMVAVECFYAEPVQNTFINENRRSIRLLKENKEVRNLPFYYNEAEFLRMELVYETNRIIRPLDLDNDTLIAQKVPFVLISQLPVDSLLSGRNMEIEYIDTFDNNWRKQKSDRRNTALISYVSIIRSVNDSIVDN